MGPLRRLPLLVVLFLFLRVAPVPAAEPSATLVVAALPCEMEGGAPGVLAVSAFVPTRGRSHTGMLLGVKTVDDHDVYYVVVVLRGERATLGETRAGRYLEVEGDGYVEVEGEQIASDRRASAFVTQDGLFEMMVEGRRFAGRGFGFVEMSDAPAADTGQHEVGHWLGLYHTFHDGAELDLAVAAPLGGAALEGYPEIAGNFRETAEGETGHFHGHLDELAAMGARSILGARETDWQFLGRGVALFELPDGRDVRATLEIATDPATGQVAFDVPALGLGAELDYRVLPCPRICRGVLFHGPAR